MKVNQTSNKKELGDCSAIEPIELDLIMAENDETKHLQEPKQDSALQYHLDISQEKK